MKLYRIITLCAITAALALSVSDVFAQNNGNGNGNGGGFGNGNGGGPGGGGGRRNRQGGGGPGGGGNFGAGNFGGGGGNFDPAAMLQRQLDNARQSLEFTNDTEWDAVAPLVQKVLEAQNAARSGQRGGFGGRGGRGGGGPGGNGAQANPELQALQDALDQNAPTAQIKDLFAKYKNSQKAKQAKLEAAQAELQKVLTTRQEAQAYLLQLVK